MVCYHAAATSFCRPCRRGRSLRTFSRSLCKTSQ
jgi:hypothetical protein